jgi:uncharacterized membrane protein YGL010W
MKEVIYLVINWIISCGLISLSLNIYKDFFDDSNVYTIKNYIIVTICWILIFVSFKFFKNIL